LKGSGHFFTAGVAKGTEPVNYVSHCVMTLYICSQRPLSSAFSRLHAAKDSNHSRNNTQQPSTLLENVNTLDYLKKVS